MKASAKYIIFCLILMLQTSLALAQNLCTDVFKDEFSKSKIAENEVIFSQNFNENIFALIRQAKKTLDVETASIPEERFISEVLSRANAGVKVRLILEGRHYNKNTTYRNLFNNAIGRLVNPNIDIRVSTSKDLSMARGYRESVLHRKITIVDGEVAYMGSSNLTMQNNFEVGLVSRDHVGDLQKIFDHDFLQVTDRAQGIEKTIPLNKEAVVQFVGPGTHLSDIKRVNLELIQNAKDTLWISAMELADSDIVQALIQKHKSNPNVDMRVVIGHRPAFYPFAGKNRQREMNLPAGNALIKAGVPVRWFEVPESVLHGRAVVTENFVLGGSADLTSRSFNGNVDLSFKTQDASIREQMKAGFLDLWATSKPAQIEKESLESFIVNRFENWMVPRLKPKGLPVKSPIEGQITYGYEVEFLPKDNPQVLNYYRLPKYSEDAWLKLTPDQRLQEFNAYLAKYPKAIRAFLTTHSRMKLEKLQSAPALLPEKLVIETHGTVEVVGEVFDDVRKMNEKINFLVGMLGKGYWQSHVVFPKEYGSNLSGFVAFSTDHAYLSSLAKSYEKFQRDPESIPGAILTHYALGPLSKEGFGRAIENVDKSLLGETIGKGANQRLINGPALRDDVYPKGLVGMELRQFSTRHEEMLAEVDFTTKLLMKNQMFLFNAFKDIQLLDFKVYEQVSPDMAASWRSFFERMGRYLEKVSTSVYVGGASYEHRLLIPLRDWKHHPVVQHTGLRPDEIAQAEERIGNATAVFKSEVNAIISQNLSEKESVTALRISISKWASASGLEGLFANFKSRVESLD